MRKGTKKKIIHGILIIIVIIFALLASLVAAFRDITVQSLIARLLAGEMSKKLNTEVKIRTFYVTEKLLVCMEDVQINDLEGFPMFEIGTLNAKFSPTMNFDDIRIKDVYFKDVFGRLVKYEGEKSINVKEVIAQLGGGKKNKKDNNDSDFRLRVDNLMLDNGHFILWNQNRDKPEKFSMDYAHLDIDSIYGDFDNLEIRNDSIFGDVKRLQGKDRCGLSLDSLSGNVLYCNKSLNVDNLLISTNESHVDLDLRFEYDRPQCFLSFVDSVRMIGDIHPTTLLLSDLKYFAWVMRQMPDKFDFTAYYDGTVSDFTVSDFVASFGEESHIDADVTFSGLPGFMDTYIDVTIRELVSSYDDTKNFGIPAKSVTVPIPEMLNGVGMYSLSGSYQGYPRDFKTQLNLITDVGDIDAQVYLNTTDESAYSFDIKANKLNLNELLGMGESSEATFELDMGGQGLEVKDTEFEADLHFTTLNIGGNEFEDFNIHGDFENQRFIALTDINHQYLDMNLSTMIDLHGHRPSYNIIAKIENADLVNLNLLDNDSIMLLSSDIDLEFSGNDIDNITGRLDIKKTRYFNGNEYLMKDFEANVSEMNGIKDVTIDCDFFDFYGTGIVNAKTFVNAMKNTAKRYVNMPEWFGNTVPDKNKQEFSLSMNFKDTRTLSKLFVPNLYVSSGTTINATYTDGYSYHGSTIESPEIWFNNLKFKNIDIRNSARFDEFISRISVDDIIIRDTTSTNPDPISLENVMLMSKFSNDVAGFTLSWDDDDRDDHNKAKINAEFVPHEDAGGLMTIMSEKFILNDTVWTLNPECSIDFQKHSTIINELALYTDSQRILIDGVYPNRDIDTLSVEFHNVDASDFDFVTIGNNLDFDGILNGDFGISGMQENLSFSSDLELDGFYINGQEVGDVIASAKWYEPSESVFVNMEVYNSAFGKEQHESVGLIGFYYPKKKRDNLKFDMFFDDFKLETVSPFITSVISRMNGFASGNLSIRGSIKEPVMVGDIQLKYAGCNVNYLNTYYTIHDDIKIEKNRIVFNNVIVRDSLRNTAWVNGSINHNHLRDFNFDLTIDCEDFLALNIPEYQAKGFYGTAVADGTVTIKGPVNDVKMTIDALTKDGTVIDIPLSGTSSLDNDFIIFVKKNVVADTLVETYVPVVTKEEKNFTMDLNVEGNSDAVVNIFLPQNMGSINARGNGNINIGLNSNIFELKGDYVITSGTFNFTLEMVKRKFTLREGGTIRWTGDPTDADINIVGVYRTKSSLTSLGTSAIDSTALTNNINVDCIIRLSDKLMNPTITFGIELPNAKEDTKNLVYSVIDTTNQAVMAQQVLSLMVLGSFSYTAGSNISRFGTTSYYSVITNQLSSWLSQISKDFDIGINYTPDDQLTNEELEVALSTQLFDDRLTIEGNFGVIRGNKNDASDANNLVGDVDLTFRLTKRLSLKAYNHTNIKNNYYYYSYENYSDFTQGIGLSFSQSFDNIREIFTLNRKNKSRRLNMTGNEPTTK